MRSKKRHPYVARGLGRGIGLVLDARVAVDAARADAMDGVLRSMLGLYGSLGDLLLKAASDEKEIPNHDRVESLIATLSRALCRLYGRAFRPEGLRRMVRFAVCYPSERSRGGLRGLRWSQVASLLVLDDPKERDFYARACLRGAWSPQGLRAEISGLAYARSRMSLSEGRSGGHRILVNRVPALAEDADCAEFLGFSQGLEAGWRAALLRSVEAFLLNLDAGFCVVERGKRFQVGAEDLCLDLVFFHRTLRCLFAVVLRAGPATEGPKDPLPFFLTWLNQNERRPGENAPVGVLLDEHGSLDGLLVRGLEGQEAPAPWYRSGLPPRGQFHAFYIQALAAAREGES